MRREYDLSQLKPASPKYLKKLKQPVTVRLDSNVLAYFRQLAKETGIPYQSLLNYVLREYAYQQLRPSANWPGRAGRPAPVKPR